MDAAALHSRQCVLCSLVILNVGDILIFEHTFFCSMFRRFLVEQLSKVNPSCMDRDQRLAFWINLYNALIMHVSMTWLLKMLASQTRTMIKFLSIIGNRSSLQFIASALNFFHQVSCAHQLFTVAFFLSESIRRIWHTEYLETTSSFFL